MKIFKNVAIYVFILLLAVLLLKVVNPPAETSAKLDYSGFKKAVSENKVSNVSIVVTDLTYKYTVTMTDGTKNEVSGPKNDQKLIDDLAVLNVPSTYEEPQGAPWWFSALPTLLMLVFIFGLVFYMMQQTQGGGSKVMQFGKSRARLVTEDKKQHSKMSPERMK